MSSFPQCITSGDKALEQGIDLHRVTLALNQAMNARSPTLAQVGLMMKYGRSTKKAIEAELTAFSKAARLYKAARGYEPDSALAAVKLALASALHARQANVSMVMSNRGFAGVVAKIPRGCIVLAEEAVTLAPNDPRIKRYRGWVRLVDYQARDQQERVMKGKIKGQSKLLKKIIEDLDVAIDAGIDLPRSQLQRCFCHYYARQFALALADARAVRRHGGTPQISATFVKKLTKLAKAQK